MKKILIIVLGMTVAFGASAQRFHGGGRPAHTRTHVIVSAGVYAPFAPYYGYGYGYPYYPYYGTPYYRHPARPTRLDLQIADIKNDYQEKIWSARHDKSLSRKERKKTVHELKYERDQAVIDAKRNYYKIK